MKFTPIITKAINTAATLHDGQERKGDGLPYMVHPFSVALILMEYSEDEDVIVAGLLHDTIEDTMYTKEQMKEEFGDRVTSLVSDLTELPKTFSWQERKDSYLKHLSTTSHESKLICAADKLHNLQSMLEAFRKFGEKAHEKFNAPTDKKLWFYEECLKIFRQDEKMPTKIIEDLEAVFRELKNQDQPNHKRRILFIECENDNCNFCIEFEYDNETFFFCKNCKLGINSTNEQLNNCNHICNKCNKNMERYDLYEEDNICPICNDMLSVGYTYNRDK